MQVAINFTTLEDVRILRGELDDAPRIACVRQELTADIEQYYSTQIGESFGCRNKVDMLTLPDEMPMNVCHQ